MSSLADKNNPQITLEKMIKDVENHENPKSQKLDP